MKKVVIILSVILLVTLFACGGFYLWGIGPKSKEENIVTFVIEPGSTKTTIAKNLENAGLIRSEYALDIYLFFTRINIQAGEYLLSPNMTPIEMLKKFENGDIKINTTTVTLIEGQRVSDYAEILSKNFDFTKEEFMQTVKDPTYLNTLMEQEEYWFLTKEILNSEIYVPLEGYLYPDTYEFLETATPKDIIETLLKHTGEKLNPYKEKIEQSGKSIHSYLTIASMVEKEANTLEDRKKASQVFYKRLELNMSLGSDVTTYYGVGKTMGDDLTYSDIYNHNPYNTRLTDGTMNGKLPIGPIANPSIESIEAALEPSETNFLFFVANVCTGEVFFQENVYDFNNKVYELQGICEKN